MTFRDLLHKLDACPQGIEWVGDKTMREAWSTCRRGDWMRWFGLVARRMHVLGWGLVEYEKMVSAWDRIEREHRLEDAMYRAFNEARLTFGAWSPQENAVWQRYSSLQCDVFRSVQPTPPPIEGVS